MVRAAGKLLRPVNDIRSHTPLRHPTRVLAARQLSGTGYELTFERAGVAFSAGQLLVVHGRCLAEERSYTICSGEQDAHLQIVYRRIETGRLTPWLASLQAGDLVDISAPYGEFTLRDPGRPICFIATGTGIAPARSFMRSRPGLDLTVIHGVREPDDLFYRTEFPPDRYFPCVSGAGGGGWPGRVTGFCSQHPLPAEAHYYLCGSNAMFYDMRDLLAARGVPSAHVFTEAYYYQDDA